MALLSLGNVTDGYTETLGVQVNCVSSRMCTHDAPGARTVPLGGSSCFCNTEPAEKTRDGAAAEGRWKDREVGILSYRLSGLHASQCPTLRQLPLKSPGAMWEVVAVIS